jgi:hypothetical protein
MTAQGEENGSLQLLQAFPVLAVVGTSSTPATCLNPSAAPFSPSFSPAPSASKELPHWLLFSPSSSEGRLSACPGRRSSFSPSPSFANVVHIKGKEPIEASDGPPVVTRSKGKAPWGGGG